MSVVYDYLYLNGEELFTFYRIPKAFFTDKNLSSLSSDAKILYGLMLDRTALSRRNGWIDELERVYIIYPLSEVMEDLSKARATVVKIEQELKDKFLIETKKQGFGKSDIIYVKDFSSILNDNSSVNGDNSSVVQKLNHEKFKNYTTRSSKIEPREVQKLNHEKFKNYTSRSSEIIPREVQKLNPNNIDISDNNLSDTNINNINLSSKIEEDVFDTYKTQLKNNIGYEFLIKNFPNNRQIIDTIVEIVSDYLAYGRDSILNIAGRKYPYERVKSKFLELEYDHIDYVIRCMENVTDISNLNNYLLTALYNSVGNIDLYYKIQANKDLNDKKII